MKGADAQKSSVIQQQWLGILTDGTAAALLPLLHGTCNQRSDAVQVVAHAANSPAIMNGHAEFKP